MASLSSLNSRIIRCRKCPRLVHWREETASVRVKRFMDETYWGRPVPGFGDPEARVLLVGLAPAAHGANRTGRMFTGDESGRWLYRALHRAGFASTPISVHRSDGLTLTDCYITAACRCAPPMNKPLPDELRSCRPFLLEELRMLHRLRVIIGLGKVGFDTAYDALNSLGWTTEQRRPRFAHGITVPLNERLTLLGSYHPSQQNTFTGLLTEPMFDAVFTTARSLLLK